MRTQHNLDDMLARHDQANGQHEEPPEPAAETEEDYLVRRARMLVRLSGDRVRNVWPVHASHWNEADRAERREWVRQLYGERQLAVKRVAELLGNVSHNTVTDDVRFLGIGRKGKLGLEGGKQLKVQARREEVKRLHAAGYGTTEIAEQLGAGGTTIASDIRQMGLAPLTAYNRVSDRQTIQVVGRAVEQLAAMAQLVLNQDGIAKLAVDEDTAKVWEQQCKIVARAVSRVRRTMKGEP